MRKFPIGDREFFVIFGEPIAALEKFADSGQDIVMPELIVEIYSKVRS